MVTTPVVPQAFIALLDQNYSQKKNTPALTCTDIGKICGRLQANIVTEVFPPCPLLIGLVIICEKTTS